MKRAVLALTALLAASLTGAADRSQPPAPGAPRPVKLPEVQRRTLSNGLAVRLVEMRELPTVQITLLLGSGAAADPKARPGVALMTADMLDEGAGSRDALALADALDGLGADLSAAASWDASSVSLHVPVRRLAEALPILADVALRPAFPPAELERLRTEALTSFLQIRDDPSSLARVALTRALFGEHRYGTPAGGDARALRALTVDDLRRFHAEHYRPGNATLIVVGDLPANVVESLERAFGSWPAGGRRPAPLPEPAPARQRVFWLIDRSAAPQAALRIAQVGPDRRTPSYYALEVMNALLGGLFTSRLTDNLRETHGYAYHPQSALSYRRVAGSFVAAADVQTPSTAPAVTEMLKELERIRTPAMPDEIGRARAYLAMSYPESFETPGQIAAGLAEQVIYDLPDDVFASYVPRVMAVDVDAARQAAATILDPKRMAIVVVGDRAKVEAPLRALNLGPLKVLSPDAVLGPMP